ncbi:RNA polymerase sigma-70 factor (ECF subfamily) [Conyzicola lurida]|uniref:RNA polymerase sigma factor n=1 Tax=Conyzicola lurida TaxID=1172621 RepID=A0A841AK78_9MICO|nr:RNA polymerase sigma-70 factor (ECF subfamily) [Conyzicola lurida]
MNAAPPGPRIALADASDSTLTARIVDGDVAAFEVLARRHGGLMRAYAQRLLGSNAESDDVVQDAFVLAWQKIGDLADGASVRSWLMRIVTTKSIDRIRARKQHADIDDWDAPTPSNQSPEHRVEVSLQMDALSSALARLPENQRRCWIMKEVGGSSYDEIAADLDVPVSTVRGQLARARQTLMSEMEAWR